MKDRWRSRRIGIDIDSHNRLTLLKTYFNSRYFFPGVRIEVKATAQGFHFRIFQEHTLKRNLEVRRALGDDPMRIFADEQRMYVGLEEWVDSVAEYTPIIIKDKMGFVDILPFNDLWKRIGKTKIGHILSPGEEIIKPQDFWTVNPRNTGWLKIRNVIRHPYNGELVRVCASGGLVDVTPNQSIYVSLNKRRKLIDAKQVKIGDKIYRPKIQIGLDGSNRIFRGNKSLAWCYGFFVAEGSAGIYRHKGDNLYRVVFANKDKSSLERISNIMKSELNIQYGFWQKKADVDLLIYNSRRLENLFSSIFYTNNRNKKVPQEILNAPSEIQKEFINGYLEGDGSFRRGKYYGFTTKSQTLAMGVLFLLLQNQIISNFRLDIRQDKPNIVTAKWYEKIYSRGVPYNEVRKIWNVDYSGYVYDIEVDSDGTYQRPHSFCAGVGPIEVHNTLFNVKAKGGKIRRERECNILSLPFCSRVPCRKRS